MGKRRNPGGFKEVVFPVPGQFRHDGELWTVKLKFFTKIREDPCGAFRAELFWGQPVFTMSHFFIRFFIPISA
jgi:hypothetical protein